MNYGIVSDKDNQTSLAYLKNKKVSNQNIVNVTRLNQLMGVIGQGDTVHVVSVDRFPSVSVFLMLADAILRSGATLRLLENPYLDIGNGKHYRPAVIEYLKVLAELEGGCASHLSGTLRLNNAGKVYVARCVTSMTISILARTYASDGILHRGS